MAKKNIKRIFWGVILMILSVISAAAAFYFLETKPQFWGDNLSTPQREFLPAPDQVKKGEDAASSLDRKEPYLEVVGAGLKPVPAPYDKKGQNGQEGFLWIDRASSSHVMTLGRSHGVEPGQHVAIYDGAGRLGEVEVDHALDSTSYVHPSGQSMDLSKNDYYRAVLE
jgi:hypothetical protein